MLELIKAVKQHKIAAMFGVEGGHMIEDDLNKLDALYNRGARYLTLTHNIAPSWATSAADETTSKSPKDSASKRTHGFWQAGGAAHEPAWNDHRCEPCR